MTQTTADTLLSAIDRESLADQAYRVIVRYVHQAGLAPGERLPSERKFSELLEVSREVIRSALERLESEKCIERKIGSGIYLRQVPNISIVPMNLDIDGSGVTLGDLYQARIALEVGAMECIVAHITDGELDRLEVAMERLAQRIRTGEMAIHEDRNFHMLLMRSCRNPVLIQLASVVQQYFDRVREQAPRMVMDSKHVGIEAGHRRVMAALRSRDADEATRAMRLHFNPLPEEVGQRTG